MSNTEENSSKIIFRVLLAFSLAFVIAAFCAGDLKNLIPGLVTICTSPSQLTTDAFWMGGLGAGFLNTGLVGLICCALLYFTKAKCTGLTVAAYWLTTGFATYGMTIPGMLPCIFGVWVYSRIKKVSFGSVANLAMFSCALAPFIAELMFRYPSLETRGFSVVGFLGAIVLGIIIGCAMPSLCAHAPNMHKGYDLYNAGPAAGFLAFVIYCILYRSPGITVPSNTNLGDGERGFVTIFFLLAFLGCLIAGYLLNGKSFKGYKELWQSDSYKTDFTAKYGTPVTLINMGVYGLFILLYYSVVHGMSIADGELVFTAAKFTGTTMGAMMCMFAFVAHGSNPKNVFPIMIGYAVASFLPFFVFAAGITETQSWTLTSQAMLVGLCYASGLAPVTGKYGWWAGIIAGALHAFLVTSVGLLHGGFCLYNGGFTAGLVALVLIPVLECFCKTKEERVQKA